MAKPPNKAHERGAGHISLHIQGGHAALTIDNPARKNAVSLAMWQTLADLVTRCDDDPAVRLISLRGTGGTFVSGADISEFEQTRQTPEKAEAYEAVNGAAFAALRNAKTPTLALIEGHCFGGGVGLAAACDLRLASTGAKLCVPPAKLGIAYPREGITDLVRLIGPGVCKKLFFTAQVIDGQTAKAIGLVEDVAEPEAFEAAAEALITSILSHAPLTQRAAKSAIAASYDDAHRAQATEDAHACFASEDYAEGARAFLEKRKPHFKGR